MWMSILPVESSSIVTQRQFQEIKAEHFELEKKPHGGHSQHIYVHSVLRQIIQPKHIPSFAAPENVPFVSEANTQSEYTQM